MNSIVTGPVFKPFLKPALAALLVASAWAPAAQAVPLNFNSYAQVYGWVYTNYSSPYLGDVSFSLQGTSDYQYSSGNMFNVTAAANYTIAPNHAPGTDPVYDIVTSNGAYGFGYNGTAKVSGAGLHAEITSSQVDSAGQAVASTPNSYTYGYAQSSWGQTLYVAPTAQHAAGTYGAILVGFSLDGNLTTSAGGYSYADMQLSSSFSDTAGVSYQSTAYLQASSNDASWTGAATTYKKLLFQYGTAFNLNAYLYAYATGNSTADFLHTGKISSIEVPFGAVLESGAEQAGLGSPASLYGVVFNSATLDDPNTNWDFGNNGGGFTPNVPVPEPTTWALFAGGLSMLFIARRRSRRG